MNASEQRSRPSPDALLERIRRSERSTRGRLKVFLGMAPGVGKTYTMLEAARARAMVGGDVVIGIAETHGRIETAELMLGLDLLPRRRIDYRGTALEEMDLEKLLARRPSLVLVDELAHTNAPGSLHAKRWLDVEELLAAGIDVYTTVNIQHVESLNDAVAQITGVRVRETVPDRMLEEADEVELVDLPVEELIARLRDGKVYVPDQAERAISRYFREGNLSALRQLALRYVATRVDREMTSYMAAHAIPGPWPTHERLLVSVGPSPLSPRLVRATRRMAERRGAEWIAVSVETPRHQRLADADRARLAQTLRLAEELGASTMTVSGNDVADELLHVARELNVTEIVVGRSYRPWWVELAVGSIVSRLVRNECGIDVYVVAAHEADAGLPETLESTATARLRPTATKDTAPVVRRSIVPFVEATASVALGCLVAALLRHELSLPNLSMVFLVAVLITAVRNGLRASIYASFLGVLVYDFFFVPPYHTFTVTSPQDILALAVFLVAAVLTSNLTGRIRDQSEASRERERRTGALYSLSRRIAGELDVDRIARAIVTDVGHHFGVDAALVIGEAEGLRVRASAPPGITLSASELAAATWTMRHKRLAGSNTQTLPGDRWLYVPVGSSGNVEAVLALRSDDSPRFVAPERRRLVEAFADLASIALERARLAQESEAARLLGERERLQTILLSSISHDLRTPLASIVGAASSLLESGARFDDEARTDLLTTIREEGERLDRFVRNLLDATRINNGSLRLNRDWIGAADVVGSALQRMDHRLCAHGIEVDVPADLPLFLADFVLVESVLVNLLDNAAKYAPHGSTITVEARCTSEEMWISVTDAGPGIPADALERVFDRFYRAEQTDQRVAGTGLGLAICRGIMREHDGTISALSPVVDSMGTRMTIRFPIAATPSQD